MLNHDSIHPRRSKTRNTPGRAIRAAAERCRGGVRGSALERLRRVGGDRACADWSLKTEGYREMRKARADGHGCTHGRSILARSEWCQGVSTHPQRVGRLFRHATVHVKTGISTVPHLSVALLVCFFLGGVGVKGTNPAPHERVGQKPLTLGPSSRKTAQLYRRGCVRPASPNHTSPEISQ